MLSSDAPPSAVVSSAIILAAGQATRLWPVSRVTPKPLLPILDRPLIDFAIADALDAGLSDITVAYDPAFEAQWLQAKKAYAMSHWDQVRFVAMSHSKSHWAESLLSMEEHFRCPVALLLASEVFEHGAAVLSEMITNFGRTGQPIVVFGSDSPNQPLGRYILPVDFFSVLRATKSGSMDADFYDALSVFANKGLLLGQQLTWRVWPVRTLADYFSLTIDAAMQDPDFRDILLARWNHPLAEDRRSA